MNEMNRISCLEAISLSLALMLLAGIGSSSPQMGGGASSQMGAGFSDQTGGGDSSQIGGGYSPQMAGGSSSHMGEGYLQQMNGMPSGHTDKSRSSSDSGSTNPKDNSTAAKSGDEGSADVLIQNWRGLATEGEKSYSVRLNVQTIKTISPDEARRLLSSNKSLEEVRSQVRESDRDTILRGSIKLNNDSYRLINITFTSTNNRSIIEANIARPGFRSGSGDGASTVGYAFVTIYDAGEMDMAEGYMVIDDSRYSLLLNKIIHNYAPSDSQIRK